MIARDTNLIERRRQEMQERIDAQRSAKERNRLGQYATPHELAVEIAQFVHSLMDESAGPIHFADPAIGSGSFFSAALEVFGREGIGSATGVELDPAFADAARLLWAAHGLEVVQEDFTHVVSQENNLPRPTVVLANPPYVRHHHLAKEDKVRLQSLTKRLTGVHLSGLAGLYVHFLMLTTAWMQDDGIAAWLIPSEFMDVNYGVPMKQYLAERTTIERVHRFNPDDAQFGDALVSSVVVVLRKAPVPDGHGIELTYGGSILTPTHSETVSVQLLRSARKWTAYPRTTANDRRACEEHAGPVLGDLFRIRRGIATGHNKYFVMDHARAVQLGLPEAFVKPILPSPRFLQDTVIESDGDGYPLIDQRLCVIDCDLSEHEVEKRFPTLWAYLKTADALGVKNGYIVRNREPWYRQEQRSPAPFLCTYMGRGSDQKKPFRFIWNRSQAIATNLYLMLYPRPALDSMLKRFPQRAGLTHDFLGRITGDELRGQGRVYGGGLNKIEPRELGRIPVTALVDIWPEVVRPLEESSAASLFDSVTQA